jgi:hypothetical protein
MRLFSIRKGIIFSQMRDSTILAAIEVSEIGRRSLAFLEEATFGIGVMLAHFQTAGITPESTIFRKTI